MRLTIAYSKIKKRNLVLINNDTYQRETLSERPIRQPLTCIIGDFVPHHTLGRTPLNGFPYILYYINWHPKLL